VRTPRPVRARASLLGSMTSIVPAIPNVTSGHAPTLEEAKAKFRAAWCRPLRVQSLARRRSILSARLVVAKAIAGNRSRAPTTAP
jgi:hypothetical protein